MAQAVLDEPKTLETSRRMTWEEFLDWNPEHLHWEWVDGEAFEVMSASINHQLILGFLHTILNIFFSLHNRGAVYLAPALMRVPFRPAGREPDLFFVARDNPARLTDQLLDGSADLVIEIVSPESDYRDKVTKLAEYERHGVREYWVLDHLEQETFFYQLDAQGKYQRVLADENGRYDCAVISGFWVDINWLWQEPKPLIEAMRAMTIIPAV